MTKSFQITQSRAVWRIIISELDEWGRSSITDIHESEDPESLISFLAVNMFPIEFSRAVNNQRRKKKMRLL